MPGWRWSFTIGGGLLLLGTLASSAQNSPLKPPANCVTEKIGQTEYLKGEVYLSSHQDTTALKHFGFKRLEFAGRSLGNVKYSAIWPRTVPLDSLATFVSGLDYAMIDDEEEPSDVLLLNATPELREALKHLAATVDTTDESRVYRRIIVSDLGSSVDYYYSYAPKVRRMRPSDVEELNKAVRGNFHVTAVDKGPLHTPESVYSPYEGNLGFVHILPQEEGPFHNVESVVEPNDPGVGTFFVEPASSGRYHSVESVTTRDNPAVGTFHVMFDPGASTLRPTDFGILRDYSTFRTGQTFFVTPSANGRPRTMSVNEWRRLYIK